MSASQSRVHSCVGSGLLALAVSCSALATPVSVTPGASDLPIPVFSGSPPTGSVLFDTGPLTDTKGTITLTLEEWAVKTSLNPGGITIAFDITTSSATATLDATLKGYGHLLTSVESCDPFTMVSLCGMATGTVSRSPGAGENLMFSSLGTTAIPPPPGGTMGTNQTNLYGIFTDASGFRTNSPVTIKDGSTTFSFTGIAPSGSSSVPEPATFGLLSLGLLGSLLGGRRRSSPGRALLRL